MNTMTSNGLKFYLLLEQIKVFAEHLLYMLSLELYIDWRCEHDTTGLSNY